MRSRRNLGLLLLLLFTLWQCGGQRHLAEKVIPIGLIPFPSETLAPSPTELNQRLMEALHSSGSFEVTLLQPTPAYPSLSRLQLLKPEGITYIVTGKFLQETDKVVPGKHIPFMAYLPEKGVQVQMEFRVYEVGKSGWKHIEMLRALATEKGKVQLAEWDPNSPDLLLDAKQRARLRLQAYRKLFALFSQRLENILEMKK